MRVRVPVAPPPPPPPPLPPPLLPRPTTRSLPRLSLRMVRSEVLVVLAASADSHVDGGESSSASSLESSWLVVLNGTYGRSPRLVLYAHSPGVPSCVLGMRAPPSASRRRSALLALVVGRVRLTTMAPAPERASAGPA